MRTRKATLGALKLSLLVGALAIAIATSAPSPAPSQPSPAMGHLLACFPGDDPSIPGVWDYCPNGELKDI